jgi:hypothetical protein
MNTRIPATANASVWICSNVHEMLLDSCAPAGNKRSERGLANAKSTAAKDKRERAGSNERKSSQVGDKSSALGPRSFSKVILVDNSGID